MSQLRIIAKLGTKYFFKIGPTTNFPVEMEEKSLIMKMKLKNPQDCFLSWVPFIWVCKMYSAIGNVFFWSGPMTNIPSRKKRCHSTANNRNHWQCSYIILCISVHTIDLYMYYSAYCRMALQWSHGLLLGMLFCFVFSSGPTTDLLDLHKRYMCVHPFKCAWSTVE